MENSTPPSPSKTVLWVEAYLEHRDPTARQLLQTFSKLREEGWRVKAWCLRSELPREEVEHVFFPAPRLPSGLGLIYFALACNLYGALRWLAGKSRPADVIHSSCGIYLGANLVSVHFMNCIWLRKQLELGFGHWKEVVAFFVYCAGATLERIHWWFPIANKFLPVSDSISEEIRRRAPASLRRETLPNGYDEMRFHPAVRQERREPMRQKLGYAKDEVVFAFVSLGHYRRKGFWLAVEALALLRAEPATSRVRFLVIGGTPQGLELLRQELSLRAPGWEAWLDLVGQQARVEDYLAAADAFLYPSYFEAFCLAEIEAAALGLPLLLTHHHGAEMVLRDGVNGWWLDFDPAAMAARLRDFLESGRQSFRYSTGAALTRREYAVRLLRIYEEAARI